MDKMQVRVIKSSINKVKEADELFNIVAFDCEYIDHQNRIMEMATHINYPRCNYLDALGEDIARCKFDRCPFGKE